MFFHQDAQGTCQVYSSTQNRNALAYQVTSQTTDENNYHFSNQNDNIQTTYERCSSNKDLNAQITAPENYPSGEYNNKDGKDDKDFSDVYLEASAAFLGPKLWDEKQTDFVDVDSLLASSPENDRIVEIVYQSLLESIQEECNDENKTQQHLEQPHQQQAPQNQPHQQHQALSQRHQVLSKHHQIPSQQHQMPPQQKVPFQKHQTPPQEPLQQQQVSPQQQQMPLQKHQGPPQQHQGPHQQHQGPHQQHQGPHQQHQGPTQRHQELLQPQVQPQIQIPSKEYYSMHQQDNQGNKDDKDFSDVCPDASAAFLGPNLWDEYKTAFIDIDSFLGNSPENERIIENLDQSIHATIQEQCNDENQTHLVQPHQLQAPQHQPPQQQGPPHQAPPQTHQAPPQPNHVPPQPHQASPQPQLQPQIQIPSEESHNMHYQDMGHDQPSPQSSMDSATMQSSYSDVDDKRSRMYSVDCKFSPTDLALATPPGHKHYDPASTVFPDDELKPQPIIKKSRKNFVPDNMKDDRYWARRYKNNIAAKRSREARRLKENQIVLRASYLEKENNNLREDINRLKAENDLLKEKIRKYEV